MINKIRNFKFVIRNSKKGMTMIELIVVLGIFAVMSMVVIYNYGSFESNVDITNLANDVALQVVTAQKAALSGLLPPIGYSQITGWKPSYGVYFSSTPSTDSSGADNKDFIYFIDLNNNNIFNGSNCQGECLSKYTITKNNKISDISVFNTNGSSTAGLSNLTIAFTRPNSGAVLYSGASILSGVSYIQITIVDQTGKIPAKIDLYPSGRVQIN